MSRYRTMKTNSSFSVYKTCLIMTVYPSSRTTHLKVTSARWQMWWRPSPISTKAGRQVTAAMIWWELKRLATGTAPWQTSKERSKLQVISLGEGHVVKNQESLTLTSSCLWRSWYVGLRTTGALERNPEAVYFWLSQSFNRISCRAMWSLTPLLQTWLDSSLFNQKCSIHWGCSPVLWVVFSFTLLFSSCFSV